MRILRPQFLIVGSALLIATLWPVHSLSAPPWEICIVDESNHPVVAVYVLESYQNYPVDPRWHDDELYTGENGCAHFLAKRAKASLLHRLWWSLRLRTWGRRFGPNSHVTAFSERLRGVDVDVRDGKMFSWHGEPEQMKSLIILKPK